MKKPSVTKKKPPAVIRKPLEPWQFEDATRLRALFAAQRKTQEQFGSEFGIGSQGMVWQYLNGKTPLNVDAARKFAIGLKCSIRDFSPRLAEQAMWVAEYATRAHAAEETAKYNDSGKKSAKAGTETNTGEDRDVVSTEPQLDSLDVEVFFLKEIGLSKVGESVVQEDYAGRKVKLPRSALRRANVLAAEDVRCVTLMGNSLEPVLPDGAILAVHLDDTMIRDGKVYAVDHDGMLRVKLLYRLSGNGISLRSFNVAEHPDEDYWGEDLQKIRIIGRMFWSSALWL